MTEKPFNPDMEGGVQLVSSTHPDKEQPETFELRRLTPEQQLSETVEGMNILQRFMFKREVGRLRMEGAVQIASAINEAIKELTIQKLSLGVDQEKKKVFLAYLKSNSALQVELQKLEAVARTNLSKELIRIDSMAAEYIRDANEAVEKMKADGLVDESGVSFFKKRYFGVAETLLRDNKVTLETMVNNHRELLERTLRIFMSRLKNSGAL